MLRNKRRECYRIDEAHIKEVLAMRQSLIYPGEDEYWVAECPSLPGCISQGATRESAIENIREAMAAYISAYAKKHDVKERKA